VRPACQEHKEKENFSYIAIFFAPLLDGGGGSNRWTYNMDPMGIQGGEGRGGELKMESGNDLVQQYFCLIGKYDDSSDGHLLHPCTTRKEREKIYMSGCCHASSGKKKVQ